MSSLRQFQGRDLVSAESSNIDLATEGKEKKKVIVMKMKIKIRKMATREDKKEEKADGELSDVDAEALYLFVKYSGK